MLDIPTPNLNRMAVDCLKLGVKHVAVRIAYEPIQEYAASLRVYGSTQSCFLFVYGITAEEALIDLDHFCSEKSAEYVASFVMRSIDVHSSS